MRCSLHLDRPRSSYAFCLMPCVYASETPLSAKLFIHMNSGVNTDERRIELMESFYLHLYIPNSYLN